MEKFADGLWVLKYGDGGQGMDLVIDGASASGCPFKWWSGNGHAISTAISWHGGQMLSVGMTNKWLAKSECKAHLAPINLLVW